MEAERANLRLLADETCGPREIESILKVLREGERFLVCSHSRPDGDAVGSVLAMGMLLKQMGKRADLVTADRIPHVYRKLPGADAITHPARTNVVLGPYVGREAVRQRVRPLHCLLE